MNGFWPFFKKEWIEVFRTKRVWILAAVFLLFAIASPLTAKLTPLLLKSMADSMPAGTVLEIPTPTALDSWAQFFGNMGQMGILILALLFGGSLSGEIGRGTLVGPLAKGLSRPAVLLAKWSTAALLWTASLAFSALVTYGYTAYYWPDNVRNLIFSVGCLWLFGLLVLAMLSLGGVLFAKTYGVLLAAGLGIITLYITAMLPYIYKYTPFRLAGDSMALLSGETNPADLLIPIIAGLGCIAGLLAITVRLFNRKTL